MCDTLQEQRIFCRIKIFSGDFSKFSLCWQTPDARRSDTTMSTLTFSCPTTWQLHHSHLIWTGADQTVTKLHWKPKQCVMCTCISLPLRLKERMKFTRLLFRTANPFISNASKATWFQLSGVFYQVSHLRWDPLSSFARFERLLRHSIQTIRKQKTFYL